MLRRILVLGMAVSALLTADTLTTKDGRVVHGTYLGGDARRVRMTVGDRVDTFEITDVDRIEFGHGGGRESSDRMLPPPPPSNAPPSGRSMDRVELTQPDRNPEPRMASRDRIEVPTGTNLVIRMIDSVDSEETRLGQTFRASLDEPVYVDGRQVIPRGADVLAKLVEDKQSGKLAGSTVLTLDLQSIQVNGQMVDVTTSDVSQSSGSRTARTGKVVGGTAAVGAIIGAIAGGGKGAAIGAASGAAVGTGAQVMTKGQRVKIPSETRLTFTLQQPLVL